MGCPVKNSGVALDKTGSNYAFERTAKQPRNVRRDRVAAQRER